MICFDKLQKIIGDTPDHIDMQEKNDLKYKRYKTKYKRL